jgi:hypothetical protein
VAGDPIEGTDPDGRCSIHDGYNGCPNDLHILNTALVSQFHEPSGQDPSLHQICVPGALRVVLAFAGHAPEWRLTSDSSGATNGAAWPQSTYEDYVTHYKIPVSAGPDPYGQKYMMYLAFAVSHVSHDHGPNVGLFGWVSYKKQVLGSTPRNAMSVANWEYDGEGQDPFHTGSPFTWHQMWVSSNIARAQMDRDVATSIGLGVPVWVSTDTASTTDPYVGLPSWLGYSNFSICVKYSGRRCTKSVKSIFHGLQPGGHAIALVGYDTNSYYYVDTCAAGRWESYMRCRFGPRDDISGRYVHTDSLTGLRHVWSISKADLYLLMQNYGVDGGAYLSYTGQPAHSPY